MNHEIFKKEKALKIELEGILAKEDIIWRQKLRETWLEVGDKNTKLFNNNTKARRNNNKISKIINVDGELVEEPKAIVEEAITYFQNVLNNYES